MTGNDSTRTNEPETDRGIASILCKTNEGQLSWDDPTQTDKSYLDAEVEQRQNQGSIVLVARNDLSEKQYDLLVELRSQAFKGKISYNQLVKSLSEKKLLYLKNLWGCPQNQGEEK